MLDVECQRLWDTLYANDLKSAPLKLAMGHEAYCRMNDNDSISASLSRLVDNKVLPALTAVQSEMRSSKMDIIRIVESCNTQAALHDKLTTKGKAFENDMATRLSQVAGIASASMLTERNSYGKQGGDLLVHDHHGNSCVIELKNKTNITQDDLDKFVNDADAWTGDPSTCYLFLKKGGIGTCRKLQEKPLIDWSPSTGRMLIWFKGDEDTLIQELPFMMGFSARQAAVMQNAPNTGEAQRRAVGAAVQVLEACLSNIRSDIAEIDKKKNVLKKREQSLLDGIAAASLMSSNKRKASLALDTPLKEEITA